MKQSPLSRAENLARREAERMGFELVDLELAREPAGRFLRLYVQKPEGIDLDDLEAYHKSVQPLFEDVDYDYMEVASPGVDRPLKRPEDYQRAIGTQVEIRFYRPVNGAKQISGTLVALTGDRVCLDTGDGEQREYRLKDIALCKPIVEFDESLFGDVPLDEDGGEAFEDAEE